MFWHRGARLLTMYDSVDITQIPRDARYIAVYVDGRWPTYEAARARWPHARLLTVTVTQAAAAEGLDIELGDALPSEAPEWTLRQIALGATRPCLYANRSTMPAVLLAMQKAGIPRTSYRLWVADYYGNRAPSEVLAGFGAWQWTCNGLGRNLDLSVTLPGFFNAKPPAAYAATAI